MQVINRQKDAFTASLTLQDFGKAMAQLDLSSVPKEKRAHAVMDHLMKIEAATIHNREAAMEITAARLMHLKQV